MVNSTIAHALDTIQLKTVPYSQEWDTGLSLPVKEADGIFSMQEYGGRTFQKK